MSAGEKICLVLAILAMAAFIVACVTIFMPWQAGMGL